MMSVISRSEPDADWSIKDEYRSPILYTSSVNTEYRISSYGDIPQSVDQRTREIISNALYEYPTIILMPVRK